MILGDLPHSEISARLAGEGLAFEVGRMSVALRSSLPQLPALLQLLYHDYPLSPENEVRSFRVSLDAAGFIPGLGRGEVEFRHEGSAPFMPMPMPHAFAMLEWGLNWCVATSMHCWLIVHAAVLERNGRAVILPGRPGAGKSTLTAVLACRGWRLLSDEHAILDVDQGTLIPAPRPISLKNESIPLVRKLFPEAILSPPVLNTHKGTISHLRPPGDSVARGKISVPPARLIFPEFNREDRTELVAAEKGRCLVELATNAFNFHVHGTRGFQALAALLDTVETYELAYTSVMDAADLVDALADR